MAAAGNARQIPQRSCDCCRVKKAKSDLLRLVCDDDGAWWPDLRQKAQGRGKYLCLEAQCLRRLNARQVQRLFATSCDRELLLHRIIDAVTRRVADLMHRLSGRALLGKDAVLQALWQSTPLLVLLADDASAGLRDRVEQAVEKHRRQQPTTRLMRAGTVARYGALYGRDRLAVIAWHRDGLTEKLAQLVAWQQRVVAASCGTVTDGQDKTPQRELRLG